MLVELLGTLVYVHSDTWEQIMEDYEILRMLHNNLSTRKAEDDIILESVMLVSTLCRNENCARLLSNSYLTKLIIDLLG
jgi:hypothetical protein